MAIKKSELYSALWKSCDELRGSMDASQYKDYVLVMLFWKYISDKQKVDHSATRLPEGCTYDDISKLKNKTDVGDLLNKKLEKIATVYHLGSGFFSNADFNNEEKLGKGKDLVDTVSNLIAIFEDPDLDFSRNHAADDDLLGDAYEYLMRNFATQSGKSKGQFYTPAEASRLAAKLLDIRSDDGRTITIYDMTAGSGSLLLRAADESRARNTVLYGQEKDLATLNMAKMNMIIHDVSSDLRLGDTLNAPFHLGQKTTAEGFDYCVANPPFSVKGWQKSALDDDVYHRWSISDPTLGLPPSGSGDYAFLMHLIRSTKPKGRAACFLPHGVLFKGGEEAKIRCNLVRKHLISGIIGLPPNIFYGTGIAACIIVIDKGRAKSSEGIFFIDAKEGYRKEGAKNRLREQDIRRIIDVWQEQREVPHFSRLVSYEEIEQQDYNLNISRYIAPQSSEIHHDLYAHLYGAIPEEDVDELNHLWDVCPTLRDQLFQPSDVEGYVTPTAVAGADVEQLIREDDSYRSQSELQWEVFGRWKAYVEECRDKVGIGCHPKSLIEEWGEELLSLTKEQRTLIDPYELYDLLMTYWEETMKDDLYIVSRDGWRVTTEIPLTKNKTPRKSYTYDQLICDLLPTTIVAEVRFPDQLKRIRSLAESIAKTEEKIEELTTEDEELFEPALDDNGQVVEALVRALYKASTQEGNEKEQSPEELKVWKKYLALVDKKKKADKKLKERNKEITRAIEALYPTLSEPEVRTMVLRHKWYADLDDRLHALMDTTIQDIISRLQDLIHRYEKTLPDLEAKATKSHEVVLRDLQLLGFDL